MQDVVFTAERININQNVHLHETTINNWTVSWVVYTILGQESTDDGTDDRPEERYCGK